MLDGKSIPLICYCSSHKPAYFLLHNFYLLWENEFIDMDSYFFLQVTLNVAAIFILNNISTSETLTDRCNQASVFFGVFFVLCKTKLGNYLFIRESLQKSQ